MIQEAVKHVETFRYMIFYIFIILSFMYRTKQRTYDCKFLRGLSSKDISSSQTAQEEARYPQGMILLSTVNSWVYI